MTDTKAAGKASPRSPAGKTPSPPKPSSPAFPSHPVGGGASSPAGQAPGGMMSAEHWVAAAEQPYEEGDDADSALGNDVASSTASLASSILHYRTINGRTYHADRGETTYWAANDDTQNESLDIIHHLLTLSLDGKLFLAPLKKEELAKVLDLGTGTGIWAMDFADAFPEAEVIGTDISPIQPTWVPPNLKFEIEDFTEDWTFAENLFDYVHMRYLYGSVPDWPALFKQAYRACKPGGWVENLEASPMIYSDDGTVREGSAMAEWGKFYLEGGRKLGRVFTPLEPLDDNLQEKALREAGFVDIHSSTQKIPIGPWARDQRNREIGSVSQLSLTSDLEGYVSFMANLLLGWNREQVIVYTAQFRREMLSGKCHGYYNQRCVWARKPESL